MYIFLGLGWHRSVGTQPISGVLSSQVTTKSNTSSEFAVLLTFEYSVEVSSLMLSATTCNYGVHFVY